MADQNDQKRDKLGRVHKGGMPKGQKTKKTITKEMARDALRQIVLERMHEMTDSQIESAIGIRHLMKRDPSTGKFELITGTEEQIREALKSNNAFWIYTKDPSTQAYTDLMNRALDKPAEQMKVTGEDGGPVIFKWQE